MAFTALLDANVLWSAAVRDTLLRGAEADLYRPVWSLRILEELARSLKERRPDLDPLRIDRTVSQVVTHFPEALVQGYEDLLPVMRNHPGDRHVLAVAVRGGASVIVSWNLNHFPVDALAPYDIDLQTPDEFLCHLWDLRSEAMALILRQQAADLVNPPMTVLQLLDSLARTVPRFATLARTSGLL